KDLIEGCKLNDRKCKEMIYKSFYGYLMGVILRYINERDDASELVNDSFIKIFKAMEKFNFTEGHENPEAAFRSWISRIASRTAIDFLRTQKSFISMDEIKESELPVTQLNALSDLNVQDILKMLDTLSSVQRTIFNMYEIEGFSHDEIAASLKIPESSCRVYLTRARQKLREQYLIITNTPYAKI
ncbi:MAG: RNA polymerase sigma factor, partial [Sphingobacteriales bacterium]